MIWILFYYNSLPDMPEGCCLFSKDVMHRDFFMCNPTNTGHFQYPKFGNLSYDSGCHKKEVNNFLIQDDPLKYVIFYTKHTSLSGEKNNTIIGYFKVGEIFHENDKKGFKASESVLLPKDKCIEINYKSRGVPVSWGNSSVKDQITKSLNLLISRPYVNIKDKYAEETKIIYERLEKSSRREEIIETCERCLSTSKCYWGKKSKQRKRDQLEKLYGVSEGKYNA